MKKKRGGIATGNSILRTAKGFIEEESMSKKPSTMAILIAVFALVVGACSPAATPGPATPCAPSAPPATQAPGASEPTPTTAPPVTLNLPAVPSGYTELDKALGADMPYKGTKVSIQVQWVGNELAGFQAAIADF